MAGPMRIHQHDVQVRFVKREVVVPTVPQDDFRFFFGLRQNFTVVHSGVDHVAPQQVRFVLFALFDCAVVPIEVFERLKTLNALGNQIAVRHRVANHHSLDAVLLQDFRNATSCLTFARAGSRGANRNDRLFAAQHGLLRPQQAERGPGGHGCC